jgi:hypothetical protein
MLDEAFREAYPAATDRDVLIAMMAFGWDLSDAGPHARAFDKPMLLVHGVNDTAMPDVTAQMLARTMQLPLGAPAPRMPFAMTAATPADRSIYFEIDIGGHAPPPGSVPPGGDSGVNAGVLWRTEVHAWLDGFFQADGAAP